MKKLTDKEEIIMEELLQQMETILNSSEKCRYCGRATKDSGEEI